MLSFSRVLPAAALLWLVSSRAAFAADQCGDVLANGIFNTSNLSTSASFSNDFTSWLCTTEFHTHQEAHDAGISFGVVVYGVPLQIGGTYADSQRDTWKKAQCQSTTSRTAYSQAYNKVVSEASDVLVNAWRDCMVSLYQTRIGLSGVAVTHGANLITLKVKWAPYDQFDTRLPKVTGFSVVGATATTVGSSLFTVGASVPATETVMDFKRASRNTPVVLTLNTDRGSVPAYVPPEHMLLRVHADLTPTVERLDTATKDYAFYLADPADDCVKDLNTEQVYAPPDGYAFSSYTFEETTKNGDRTSYRSGVDGNGVHFWMHVQGDDGTFGFCKRHGWLGLAIHVTGTRWNTVSMTESVQDVPGLPGQRSVLVKYPFLTPGQGQYRNFTMPYTARVEKVIGDDVSSFVLTPGVPTSGGVTATADGNGNLVIDGSAAFDAWEKDGGAPIGGPSSVATLSHIVSISGDIAQPSAHKAGNSRIDRAASAACKAKRSDYVVYSISEAKSGYVATCGSEPREIKRPQAAAALVSAPFAP